MRAETQLQQMLKNMIYYMKCTFWVSIKCWFVNCISSCGSNSINTAVFVCLSFSVCLSVPDFVPDFYSRISCSRIGGVRMSESYLFGQTKNSRLNILSCVAKSVSFMCQRQGWAIPYKCRYSMMLLYQGLVLYWYC